MRALIVVLLLCLAVPAAGQEEGSHRTEHLVLQWAPGDLSQEGVAYAEELGERLYAAIAEMLGSEPKFPVTIVFEGPAERPDGSRGYPRVDGWGRIRLYNFGPTHHSYFSALAHEMVHVFRIHRRPHHDWFFEEGFAEFVARRVDDNLNGFPWYGFDPALVAGQWVDSGEDLPLADLRDRHEELSLPCKLQSYALRYSFFDFLGRTFGDDQVVAMSAADEAGAREDYPDYFGTGFAELEEAWRKDLVVRYAEIEAREELAHQYRNESPAQYQPVCADEPAVRQASPGVD